MTPPLLQFFDRIYVVNLPERHDRRLQIMDELAQIGVPAAHPKLEIFAAIRPTEIANFPSLGARGCFLSHLHILVAARDAQLKNLLILEDDLAFTSFFVKNQAEILTKLNECPWQMAYFGHVLSLPPLHQEPFAWQPTQAGLQTSHFLSIQGEILSQLIDFLELVLSRPPGHPLGGAMHVDGAYSTFRQQNSAIKTLIANPCLGFQRSSPSDVAKRKWFDRIPGLHQLAVVGRAWQTQAKKI